MAGGGSIVVPVPVHKLLKSIYPQWKLQRWSRQDINLSWKGSCSGKITTRKGG